MRKVSYWLLAGCLALALTACSDDDDNGNGKPDAGTDGPITRTDGPVTQQDGPVTQQDGPVVQQDQGEPEPDQGPIANNVGKECNGDADCGGGDYFCLQLYGNTFPGVCTLECTPDDPDTDLHNEDSCPGLSEGNLCLPLPADLGTGNLCFQTCVPTSGQNTCDGSIACDFSASTYYFEYFGTADEMNALCAVPGCTSDADCYVLGQDCNTATPNCPTGQECLAYEQGSTEGVCVQAGNCDSTTHLCAPHDKGDDTALVGDPCQNDLDCAGNMNCVPEFEDQSGEVLIRNGYCSVVGCWYGDTLTTSACPNGSACNSFLINGYCMKTCDLEDASTCRGVEADRLGDYECRNYANVFDNGEPLCDFGFFFGCDIFADYGLGCEMVGAGTFNTSTGQIEGNPTNMSCRNLADEELQDPLDPNGYCLDDTPASPLLRGQDPDAGTPATDAGVN